MDPTRLPQVPYGPRFADGVRQEPSMERRTFMALVSGGLLAAPIAAEAQQARKVPRIALFLPPGPIPEETAFRDGMRELGWVGGQNITIERRSSDGYPGRYPERLEALLADVLKLNFDVVVGSGEAITMFAKRAPSTVAVVMAGVGEPVEAGLVKSLAQPGGNVTGLASLGLTIDNKRLQLLKEAIPQISRVAFLDSGASFNPELVAAADSMALKVLLVKIDASEDFHKAFANIIKQRADALFVGSTPFFWAQRHVIVEFAERQRLPAMYPYDVYVKSGGLMSYGTSFSQIYRRAATYVDKILKGTKPGDLPIEQATKFDLIINLKTAKALGLTIPPSLLGRADEVIQ